MLEATALMALSGAAAFVSASPIVPLSIRDSTSSFPANCKLLSKPAYLGFNTSSIGIYNDGTPQLYLGFEESPYGGLEELQSTLKVAHYPSFFFLPYGCDHTYDGGVGKGSVQTYTGYLSDPIIPGNCIGVSALKSQNATLVSSPCDFSSGSVQASQKFQFSSSTFFKYQVVSFLGDNASPANADFQEQHTGYSFAVSGYKFYINYDPANKAPKGLAYDLAFDDGWTQQASYSHDLAGL
ncbi:hypothetical protein K437DRAFT_130690 [Tilletiaria anomala UBC 951]|uniref:Uncharacterized protein n=1 Tax=Tilletiaria anomala (strain ATCC 24038 / CBS 436.72 / UBC 951) TaxID=1037660 RepID=A0A066VWM5_TILAU|nr:uncharacterized protein K437DRAFT_130690 [Tilletiaria anomala UBC 951]KDN44698.1 hypothetical protein K437DRAFT_130690 [Tilletiaria anomala UBC 951]